MSELVDIIHDRGVRIVELENEIRARDERIAELERERAGGHLMDVRTSMALGEIQKVLQPNVHGWVISRYDIERIDNPEIRKAAMGYLTPPSRHPLDNSPCPFCHAPNECACAERMKP
jgi:hypothetical protein